MISINNKKADASTRLKRVKKEGEIYGNFLTNSIHA